jgi:hypothetical protein
VPGSAFRQLEYLSPPLEINTKAKQEALRAVEPPDTSEGSRIKPIWQSDESLLNWLASL